jgi:hypothetical protein
MPARGPLRPGRASGAVPPHGRLCRCCRARPLLAGVNLHSYLSLMRAAACVTAMAGLAAWAQAAAAAPPVRVHHSWTPVAIGTFGDWQAATHPEAGVTVCYAFSFAHSSKPVLVGRGRVVLTVAERPGERDAVAVSLGYAVLPHAGASVQAGGKKLHFYLEGRSAFAPHGQEAIAAFQAGREAVGSFPGPRGLTLADSFSLNGFAAAYEAVQKACPAGATLPAAALPPSTGAPK